MVGRNQPAVGERDEEGVDQGVLPLDAGVRYAVGEHHPGGERREREPLVRGCWNCAVSFIQLWKRRMRRSYGEVSTTRAIGNARPATRSRLPRARSGKRGCSPPPPSPASAPWRRNSSSNVPLLTQTRSREGFRLTKNRRIRSPCVAPYAPASTWISSLLACGESPRPSSSIGRKLEVPGLQPRVNPGIPPWRKSRTRPQWSRRIRRARSRTEAGARKPASFSASG